MAGETYERAAFGRAPDLPSTRVIAEQELGGGVWMVRKANGLETVASATDLTGPVKPLRPGVEEPCLLCAGEKVVPIDAPKRPDRPWERTVIGHEPCPNCASGLSDAVEA